MTRQQRAARADPRTTAPEAGGRIPSPVLTLDALGKKCPIPIIMLADRITEVGIGQTIAVLADDPAAKTDLPAWCALKSQEFIRADELPASQAPGGHRVSGSATGRSAAMYWSFLVRRCY